MTAPQAATDMGVGLAMVFGAFAVVASVVTVATSYLQAIHGEHAMQTASGVAIAAAMVFAGLSVVALHRFDE